MRLSHALAAAATALATACGPVTDALNTALAPDPASKVQTRAPTPNPDPKEYYDIVVEVSDAPGEFERAQGYIAYQIAEKSLYCMPRAKLSGASQVPLTMEVAYELKKTSATTFEGILFVDRFIPKNDYGLGECEWEIVSAGAYLFNGTNIHDVSVSPTDRKVGDKYQISEGVFRGRRAYLNRAFTTTIEYIGAPERKPSDPPVVINGGWAEPHPKKAPPPSPGKYYISITATRNENTP